MSIRQSFDRMYLSMSIMEECVSERNSLPEVSHKEMLYLYIIALTEDCTASRIAEMLGVSLPAVTKRLNALEERGLISRTRSEEDGRVKTVTVSERGGDLMKRADEIFYRILGDMEVSFSQEEVEVFCRMMDHISDRLGQAIKR